MNVPGNVPPAAAVPPAVVPPAGAQPVVAPLVPAGAPVFALMPSAAYQQILDYTTREGMTIFRANTRCLYTDTTCRFEAKPEGLQGFLLKYTQRSREADWTAINEVPVDVNQPLGETISFIAFHGTFLLTHLQTFAATYVAGQNRAAQDNFQAVTAVMESITEDAVAKIQPFQEQYTVNGQVSVLCLIKVLIRESNVDTNASCRIARENLGDLDKQIKVQGYDIDKLNAYIQTQLLVLRSRGEQTLDLLANLFKGYGAAVDEDFLDFVKRRKADYDEGTANMDFNAQLFMTMASSKFKILSESGTYNTPSKDQVKILALEAKVKKMEQGTTKPPKSASATGSGDKSKRKSKVEFPTWMKKRPSDADVQNEVSKSVGGKTFYWCSNHERYVQHKPSECKFTGPKNEKPPVNDDGDNDRALRLDTALQAEVGDDDDYADDE